MQIKKKDSSVKPFLKWAGGKRQLLPEIRSHLPANFKTYYEPFLGGGAVLFDCQPERAVVNDINGEITNVYSMIKEDVDGLISRLKEYKNEADYYYEIRELDRTAEFSELSPLDKAARIIYLNKTCFNGLFRVNTQGQFNVPFGKYKRPNIVNEETLRALNRFLNSSRIEILNTDFEKALAGISADDFVYFDPPYDPLSDSSSFTGYTLHGFSREEQRRLKELCDNLNRRGVKFLLSNSATPFIKELYAEYTITYVKAKRNINSVGNSRGKIDEVLVRNYG